MIERYDTFNTKGCTDELIFGHFNDKPITSDYYNLLNTDNDGGNNVPDTPVDDAPSDSKGLEDTVIPNDKDINNEIIIDDDYSLASDIDPLQSEIT